MTIDFEANDFYARLAFSEADKSNMENFEKDAIAILHVANNRALNPKRFGYTMDKLYDPKQFNGVGSAEWYKPDGNMTPKEEAMYKRALQLSKGVMYGSIPDPTDGADHYYNPKISDPDWGKLYPEKYRTSGHRYLKEVPLKKR